MIGLIELELRTFRPLVCASFMRSDIKSEQRVKLFKSIERFIFIAFRIGRATANYRNAAVYRLTKQLRSGEVSIQDVINQLDDRIENWLTPSTGIDIQSLLLIFKENSRIRKDSTDGMEFIISSMNMKVKL